ncbi:hypothetical protein OF83DRAFT_1080937 [Amylostereum chailletii]|nr:hypothetical protein OF83DRAFT_1080937 [Amylostereum chailletii]
MADFVTPPTTPKAKGQFDADTFFADPIPAPNLLGQGTPDRGRRGPMVQRTHNPEVTLGYRGLYVYFGLGDTETQEGSPDRGTADEGDCVPQGPSAGASHFPEPEQQFWDPLEITTKGILIVNPAGPVGSNTLPGHTGICSTCQAWKDEAQWYRDAYHGRYHEIYELQQRIAAAATGRQPQVWPMTDREFDARVEAEDQEAEIYRLKKKIEELQEAVRRLEHTDVH